MTLPRATATSTFARRPRANHRDPRLIAATGPKYGIGRMNNEELVAALREQGYEVRLERTCDRVEFRHGASNVAQRRRTLRSPWRASQRCRAGTFGRGHGDP